MASTSEIRDWARDQGYDVGVKGNLPAAVRAAWDAAHPGGNGDTPDYDAGITGDDFGVSAAAEPPEQAAGQAETPPKRPPRQAAKPAGKTWRWGRKQQGKTKAKARPRVPVDDVISGAWRIMARIARPVPALQRTLRVQSPVAGILLEDAVKGTIVDTVLQPVARMQAQGKTVAALAGPPLLVTAISMHLAHAAQAEQPPNPVFMGAATEMLRESLMLWMDVAGPKFEQALAREQEFEKTYGAGVDQFMEWLFAPPANPADEEAVKAEEDAIRRAQGIL
jgi:hypothetical protein